MLNAFIRHVMQSTQTIQSELKILGDVKESIEKEKLSSKKLAESYNKKHKEIQDLLVKRKKNLKKEIQKRQALETRINRLANESYSLHDLINGWRHLMEEHKHQERCTCPASFVLPKNAEISSAPVIGPVISTFGKKHAKLDTEGAGLFSKHSQIL